VDGVSHVNGVMSREPSLQGRRAIRRPWFCPSQRIEGYGYFACIPREARNLGAKFNGYAFEASHFDNFTPRSGTLFRTFRNVKRKQLFGGLRESFGLKCQEQLSIHRRYPCGDSVQ